MHKTFLFVAALLGAASVALGAFGAHALKAILDTDTLAIYETAVRYQFYHVFALLAAGVLYGQYKVNFIIWCGCLFLAGILLFSGSLYALVFIKNAGNTSLYWVGAITPVGGLCFMAGWVCMALGVKKG